LEEDEVVVKKREETVASLDWGGGCLYDGGIGFDDDTTEDVEDWFA